jgi:hypothetical protein
MTTPDWAYDVDEDLCSCADCRAGNDADPDDARQIALLPAGAANDD